MPRNRRVLAFALLAALVCADRAVAAPTLRPHLAEVAAQATRRLVASFCRVVPSASVRPDHRGSLLPPLQPRLLCLMTAALPHPAPLSPPEHRLPPPLA